MSTRLNVIRQYMAAVTGKSDIVVVDTGPQSGAATHVPQRVVRLDANAPYALDLAAHEGIHITRTDPSPFANMYGSVKFVANALEDARMEVAEWRVRPGLRPLMERGVIAASLPSVYDSTDWLVQALKAFYLESAGWQYDRKRLRPKARKVVDRFVKAGYPERVRNAPDSEAIAEITREVVRLFDEIKNAPSPTTSCQPPQPVPFDPENDDEPEGDPEPTPRSDHRCPDCGRRMPTYVAMAVAAPRNMCLTCGQYDTENSPDRQPDPEGEPGDDDETDNQTDNQTDNEPGDDDAEGDDDDWSDESADEAGEQDDEQDGEGKQEGEPEPESEPKPVRGVSDADYDADDMRDAAEAAKRLGVDEPEPEPEPEPEVEIEDRDYDQRVTGGPAVNQLLKQAKRLEREMRRLDAAEREALRELAEEDGDWGESIPAPVSAPVNDARPQIDPHAQVEVSKLGGELSKNPFYLDLSQPAKAVGLVGYTGWGMTIAKVRGYNSSLMTRMENSVGGLSAWVNRVIRTLLQTNDRRGWTNHEKSGRFDLGRGSAMCRGSFDVYRQRESAHPGRPAVVMTVDTSGSMDYAWGGRTASMEHAAAAAYLVSDALSHNNVKFEVHGFGGSVIRVYKEFHEGWTNQTKLNVATLLQAANGGTPAAEALAFAYIRALSRPEARKVIIFVTDGAVAENTAKVAKQIAERPDVTLIGIGIGEGTNIGRHVAHYIEVKSATELPGRLAVILRSLASKGLL